jgi:hypothetical protein
MSKSRQKIPPLFLNQFSVDFSAPFHRHLNRLEVEIGKEDYHHLKRVELVEGPLPESFYAGMADITGRILATTQNHYNRSLLLDKQIRVLLDLASYRVYYRFADRAICFHPWWRERVLRQFFQVVPRDRNDWHPCRNILPGFEARFEPDEAGGALLIRRLNPLDSAPLFTAVHGPYDPHTLEVTLYLLRAGHGNGALINLGFAGREPLADSNLEKLKAWGVPLNPSNIDVIYPYLDQHGEPCCYKMERNLGDYIRQLEIQLPSFILDIHGCVGTSATDNKVVVGLGGLPPYQDLGHFGRLAEHGSVLHLFPDADLREGLTLVRGLSEEVYVQFCLAAEQCFHFALLGGLQLVGRQIEHQHEVESMLEGEERTFLPSDAVRWLPGAGANALQRRQADRLKPGLLCLHVEIPTAVRRRMVLKLREQEIISSLDSSGL